MVQRWLFRFIIAAAILFAVTPQASARDCLCGTPPHESAYEGLFPPGVQPATVDASLTPAALADMKIVIVPSANFIEYSRRWVSVWEPGGLVDRRVNALSFMTGLNREQLNSQEHLTDPRVFADQVSQILQASFREVAIADDLAAAHDLNADMYLVVDAWMGTSALGGAMRAWHGAYLLDGSLNQVAAFPSQGSAQRGMNPFASVVEADRRAYANAVARSTGPVLEGLRGALGQPTAAEPAH